jgi:uncharacterized protein (DUF1697 family)
MTYLAFLRGINVSGQKIIKMTELAGIIEDAGFGGVKTFLASGNVAFETTLRSEAAVTKKLGAALRAGLGYEVAFMLRTLDELRALVELDPFAKAKAKAATQYVTFFASAPPPKPKPPLISPKGNVEVIQITGRDAFSLSTTIPRGDYPNPYLEKTFGIPATTRNWKTVERITSEY